MMYQYTTYQNRPEGLYSDPGTLGGYIQQSKPGARKRPTNEHLLHSAAGSSGLSFEPATQPQQELHLKGTKLAQEDNPRRFDSLPKDCDKQSVTTGDHPQSTGATFRAEEKRIFSPVLEPGGAVAVGSSGRSRGNSRPPGTAAYGVDVCLAAVTPCGEERENVTA